MVVEELTMEFMKIGDKSLKISLNAKESKLYGLDESTEINTDDMKGSFSKLLSRAKKEVGYSFSGERVVAEIFNSKNGGCEIFLTYGEKEVDGRNKNNVKRSTNGNSIFSINDLNGVISIIRSLLSKGYNGKSSLYYDNDQKNYYLLLDEISTKNPKYYFMGEYARQLRQNSLGYIKEHCRCICKKDAIQIMFKI